LLWSAFQFSKNRFFFEKTRKRKKKYGSKLGAGHFKLIYDDVSRSVFQVFFEIISKDYFNGEQNVVGVVVDPFLLGRLSLSLLADERLVDVGDDSSSGDGGLDERVQLFVSSDGELQVARGDSLHLQVLGRVAGQLEDLKYN
jgi:hypothetical protein